MAETQSLSAGKSDAVTDSSAPEPNELGIIEITHDEGALGPKYKRGRGRSFFKQARKGVVCQGKFEHLLIYLC